MFLVDSNKLNIIYSVSAQQYFYYDCDSYKISKEPDTKPPLVPCHFIYSARIADITYYVFVRARQQQGEYTPITRSQLLFYPKPPCSVKSLFTSNLRNCYTTQAQQSDYLVFNRHSLTLCGVLPEPIVCGHIFSIRNLQFSLKLLPDGQGARFHSRGLKCLVAANSAVLCVKEFETKRFETVIDKKCGQFTEKVPKSAFFIARGTAPVKFSQNVGWRVKPRIILGEDTNDTQKSISILQNIISDEYTFSGLQQDATDIVCIDLMKPCQIGQQMQRSLLQNYENFDLNGNNRQSFIKFLLQKLGSPNLLRINCLDSSDRTQLAVTELAILKFGNGFNFIKSLLMRIQLLKSGNIIARRYVGTNCQKLIENTLGIRNPMDKILDLLLGVIRYFRNRTQNARQIEADFWNSTSVDLIRYNKARRSQQFQRTCEAIIFLFLFKFANTFCSRSIMLLIIFAIL